MGAGTDAGLSRTRLGQTSLLDFDPTLEGSVPADQRALARSTLLIDVREYQAGSSISELDEGHAFGILIGTGWLVRETIIEGSRSLEPLGPGDIIRPWQSDVVSFATSRIRALSDVRDVRVASLDREFARQAGRFPELIARLVDRVMSRSRYLALYGAIGGLVGVKKRLVFLMWTLAERWGSVHASAIFLPLEFQHGALAYLVGARRPSVSTALAELRREGIVERCEGGWILRGEPPPLARLTSPPSSRSAKAAR